MGDLGQRSKRRAAGRRQVELSVRGSAAVVRVELMGSGGQGGWWLVGFSSFAQAQGACPGSAFSGLMDTARWGGGDPRLWISCRKARAPERHS